jgi:hypothetical protein
VRTPWTERNISTLAKFHPPITHFTSKHSIAGQGKLEIPSDNLESGVRFSASCSLLKTALIAQPKG